MLRHQNTHTLNYYYYSSPLLAPAVRDECCHAPIIACACFPRGPRCTTPRQLRALSLHCANPTPHIPRPPPTADPDPDPDPDRPSCKRSRNRSRNRNHNRNHNCNRNPQFTSPPCQRIVLVYGGRPPVTVMSAILTDRQAEEL